MSRIKQFTWMVAAAAVISACAVFVRAQAVTDSKAQEATAGAASQPAAQAKTLRSDGLSLIFQGKLDDGLKLVEKAAAIEPNDPLTGQAVKDLEDYLQTRNAAAAQRQAEYKMAVARVQRAAMAEKQLGEFLKSDAGTKMRRKVRDMGKAYGQVATSETLLDSEPDKAAKLKEQAHENLAKIQALSGEVVKALSAAKASDECLAEIRSVGAKLQTQLTRNLDAWKRVKTDTDAGRAAGAKGLADVEEDLADALSDVDTLTSRQPWRVALLNARLAKQISIDSDKMPEQSWYKDLVADAQARGEQSISAARWYDALNAYISLEELEPDNEAFHQKSKDVRSHVRVLRLYGGPKDQQDPAELAMDEGATSKLVGSSTSKPSDGSTTQPEPATTTAPADDQLNWRELTEGVDAEMVRSAITRINESYVSRVDYRKVARGALRSIQVLAQTPQASYSFPALGEKGKRQKFVDAIDSMLDSLAKEDNIDYSYLQRALNGVIRASQDSVEIPTAVLSMEFADGLLEEMDRFSNMIWPHDVKDFEKQTMGRFCGVGIQITKEIGEPLKVVTPLAGSPAYRAGIRSGDLVLTVDGQKTDALLLDRLIGMIMGEPGTTVKLGVQHRGQTTPVELIVSREEINIQTVKGWKGLPDGKYDYMIDPAGKIGYIRLTQFTDQTTRDMDEVLKSLKKQGVRSLILDLRFNPGGLLRAAAGVSDEFLPAGKRIVSTKGDQVKPSTIDAQAGGEYLNGDLVVLVNDTSASAAEIVSGALKDWKRGIIVGERSYGKGSVQNVIPIPKHNAYLKLTTAYYYLPMGRCLHRRNGDKVWGVDPDVGVNMTPRQLKHWLDIRRRTDLLQDEGSGQSLQSDLASQFRADIQLNTAVMILKLMRLQGDQVAQTN